MAVNPYLQSGSGIGVVPEQQLIQNLIDEQIRAAGHHMSYIPRTVVEADEIFGEDKISHFLSHKTIETYVNNPTGFGGGGYMLSKFGLEIQDNAEFVVSRPRFRLITGLEYPVLGDLMYFPVTKSLFEITEFSSSNPFYQLSKETVFTMTVELFTFSEETFDTGIEELDAVKENLINDFIGDNDAIEQEAAEIVDKTESSPFGGF